MNTCMVCEHCHPAVFCRGQARNVGYACTKTGLRVYPDGRARACDLFRTEAPPHGWQPDIEVELL